MGQCLSTFFMPRPLSICRKTFRDPLHSAASNLRVLDSYFGYVLVKQISYNQPEAFVPFGTSYSFQKTAIPSPRLGEVIRGVDPHIERLIGRYDTILYRIITRGHMIHIMWSSPRMRS